MYGSLERIGVYAQRHTMTLSLSIPQNEFCVTHNEWDCTRLDPFGCYNVISRISLGEIYFFTSAPILDLIIRSSAVMGCCPAAAPPRFSECLRSCWLDVLEVKDREMTADQSFFCSMMKLHRCTEIHHCIHNQ